MSGIKIKKELLPTRCEICHQSDQFIALESYCLRCNGIYNPNKVKFKTNFTKRNLLNRYRKRIRRTLDELEKLEDSQSNLVDFDDEKHNQIKSLKFLADYLKRATLGTTSLSLITHFVIESYYVTYYISPQEHSPFWLNLIFRLSFLITFILGLFTFPKWYSVLAFLSIGFIILSIGGR